MKKLSIGENAPLAVDYDITGSLAVKKKSVLLTWYLSYKLKRETKNVAKNAKMLFFQVFL